MQPQQVQPLSLSDKEFARVQRLKLLIAFLTMLAAVAVIPPAWWNMEGLRARICATTGLFCEASSTQEGQQGADETPAAGTDKQPSNIPPVKELSSHERLLKVVPGLWQSRKSAKRYLFTPATSPDTFDVYADQPGASPIKIGTARIIEDYLEATVNITVERNGRRATRVAVIRLTPLQDGREMQGSYNGLNSKENGSATFIKVDRTVSPESVTY